MNPSQKPFQPAQESTTNPHPIPAASPNMPPPIPMQASAPVADPAVHDHPFASQPIASAAPVAPGSNPGRTLGIVSLVLAFVGMGLISLILGVIGLRKSKHSGYKNGFAVAGIVLGIIEIVIGLIVAALFVMALVTTLNTCSELGTGTHVLTSGASITCNGFAP